MSYKRTTAILHPTINQELFATFKKINVNSTSVCHNRTIQLLVENCGQLQRQRAWWEPMSAIHCAYLAIVLLGHGLPKAFCSEQILLVKSALIKIPRPLGRYASLEEVEQVLHLDNTLLEVAIPLNLDSINGENSRHEKDRGSVTQEDDVIRDESSATEVQTSAKSKSTNEIGIT